MHTDTRGIMLSICIPTEDGWERGKTIISILPLVSIVPDGNAYES